MDGASESDESKASSFIKAAHHSQILQSDSSPRMPTNSTPQGGLLMKSVWLLLLCTLLTVPGCGGCFNSSSSPPQTAEQLAEAARKKKEEEQEKKKKEKKADFEFGRLTLQPGTRGVPSIFIKPGHWISAIQSSKTNNFDFLGELDAAIVDPNGNPIDLDSTPFRISTTRPAALPKGQLKYLDMTFFVPHAMRRARLNSSLRGSYAGSSVNREDALFNAIPPYQYLMLVLARTPERYGFLNQRTRDFMFVPWSDYNWFDEEIRQYSVIQSSAKLKPVLLPSDSLTWTSMAYFFWDDVDPSVLSKEQQQALLDWVHWGGQLIISGPGSLPGLKDSFLAPYLPAISAGAREYTTEDLAELNTDWTLPIKGKPGYPLKAAKPWSGVELQLHAEAKKIPKTAGLLAERRIGLGRISLSAIHLSQPELTRWPSFSGFFNACVLRRGARKWEKGELDVRLAWAEGDPRPDDPTKVSQVRYFSRDAASTLDYHVLTSNMLEEEEVSTRWQLNQNGQFTYGNPTASSDGILSTSEPIAMGGVASWNSFSPASNAAREALREAAGVTVPKAWFVMWVVGLYIFIVVPVNWLVFYVIGRLEWAWVAAPLVAVAFSILVVRLAQLDIGFVRAETEIGILELQPDYKRGHLTRYKALYTSLGTQYQWNFDDKGAVALPMPLGKEFQLRTGQDYTTVGYRRFDEVTLNDVTVSSNSTGMLHAEQMVSVPQPIRLSRSEAGLWTVRNGSEFDLEAAAVLRKADSSFHKTRAATNSSSGQNEMTFAWIGTLKAGEVKTLSFSPFTNKNSPQLHRGDLPLATQGDNLDLERLYGIAESPRTFSPGETRLVGRMNKVIPGASITPVASQLRGATLIVAHLDYGNFPEPMPDVNTKEDISLVELEILPPEISN